MIGLGIGVAAAFAREMINLKGVPVRGFFWG